MILLNFSHPLTDEHVTQIESLTEGTIERVVEVEVHFDSAEPFGPQVTDLADRCALTSSGWQTSALLVVTLALSAIAVLLMADLHGRMGYSPACVRVSAIEGTIPTRYEVVELLNLQGQREGARQRRTGKESADESQA